MSRAVVRPVSENREEILESQHSHSAANALTRWARVRIQHSRQLHLYVETCVQRDTTTSRPAQTATALAEIKQHRSQMSLGCLGPWVPLRHKSEL